MIVYIGLALMFMIGLYLMYTTYKENQALKAKEGSFDYQLKEALGPILSALPVLDLL